MKSEDARLYYALLDLSIPDSWDDVVGGYVSYKLTQVEQTYIIKNRIGLNKLDEFIEKAKFYFADTKTVYYKHSKWTTTSIKALDVDDALSTIGWQFSNNLTK